MKAALVSQYNKNNINLEMTEIPIPQIGPYDVLIKARAAGGNPLDNMISRGEVKIIVPYKLPQMLVMSLSELLRKSVAK
ncbi:hypothetical protein JCM5176_01680 [Streptococcus sobrinus]|nr:hypothetical protein DLJ52_05430 [Streptococcus sobrinus]